ncbi:MAG: ABC transporter permease subunit [Deltaproteobacteria bacterium]|nr:ABC transporter permease subunit [Deltaproteobacteria bacterium]
MRGWYPVFRKETANFFVSPIAYAVIAIFLLISGFFFWANMSLLSVISMQAASNPGFAGRLNITDFVLRPMVQNMSIILLFVMPLLSMRLFSEEKKSGTIELLLTYPISDSGVMAGKFLAAMLVLAVMLAGTFTIPALMFALSEPDPGVIITSYLGMILMAAAFTSMGMFVSSMTENQIISAAVSFGAAILFWLISWTSSLAGDQLGFVLRQLSVLEHLESFHKGIVSLSDVSFFVLFTAFFLFLTLRTLETYRWRG